MRTLLFFIFIAVYIQATPNQWELIWSDEFDQSGLPDNSKWEFDTEGNSWDWGNDEEQNYTPSDNNNAWVGNGILTIEARQEEYTAPEDSETKQYTSARLRTKNLGDWLEGRFEVRAKIPAGIGTWPAIWMLPTDDTYGGWPNSGEIDIMEAIGSEPSTHYCNVWTTNNESEYGTGNTFTLENRSEQFYTYAIEWSSDSILFFVEDTLVHTYYNEYSDEKQWPFDQRFHILLNLAVGGNWETEVELNSFPAQFQVDYVRIFHKQKTAITYQPNVDHKSILMQQTDNEIQFTLDNGSFVSIDLFLANGQHVLKQEYGYLSGGYNEIALPTDVNSGLYIARMNTADGTGEMKLLIP